jgi:formyltetrahydrofolate deformylase
MSNSSHILTLSCPDKPGLVAGVARLLADHGGNIRDSQQFNDTESNRFFMRIAFDLDSDAGERALHEGFAPFAAQQQMDWQVRPTAKRRKVILMVSKFDHCLGDLLYRQRIGELAMDIVGIICNHTKDTKPQQEAAIKQLVAETGAELVVLARYMQILSDDMAGFLSGRCINIHHSFLPGFKGAKPYHQAHARGVKMIGATAHYVTADLDEGPIIHQDVEAISHSDTPDDLVRKGRDIERRVLARAVHLHLEDRVFMNGNKTIVFSD